MELDAIAIFFRWLHVLTACVLVGSVFYFHLLLPMGTRGLDSDAEAAVLLRTRRSLKMTVHVSLLMFLISGIFNATRNWHVYKARPLMHGLFGTHLLLGLGGVTLLMIILAGREMRRSRMAWMRWALVGLILAIAAASTLKSAREYAVIHPFQTPAAGH
jgi:uncharacterized membrane protein